MLNYCVLISLFLFINSCTNEQKNTQIKYCGSTHFGSYYPKEIKSLINLPSAISDSVTNHLKRYLGAKFYDLLSFEEGTIINYSELLEKNPSAKNYRWQVPAYELGFMIRIPKTGINSYCSRINLDSLGNVIGEIDFPGINENPINTTFIDKNEIMKVVSKSNFSSENYEVGFNKNHLALVFTRWLTDGNIEYLYVSAHTGKILTQEVHHVLF